VLGKVLQRLGLAAPPPEGGVEREDPRTLASSLIGLLEDARPVPLTREVRIDKNEVHAVVGEIRSASSPIPLVEAAGAVEDAVRNAMPVPLTDQVRLPRERVAELIQGLRLAAQAGLAAR
jgi:hypothetical protein